MEKLHALAQIFPQSKALDANRMCSLKKLLLGLTVLCACLFVWVYEPHRDDVEELTHLHGKTEDEVIDCLGNPGHIETLTLKAGTTLPEFYIEVHNTYPSTKASTEGIKIKVSSWGYAWHHKSVFIHKVGPSWVVLESVRYKNGVEF